MLQSSGTWERLRNHWPVGAAFIIAGYITLTFFAPTRPITGIVASIILFVIRGLAAWTAISSIRSIQSKHARRAWQNFAIALLIWALAEGYSASWSVLVGSRPESPSLANLFQLAGYLAALTALVILPVSPPERFGRVREALDLLILGIAVITLSWLVFVRPILDVGLILPHSVFWIVVPPVFDLILLVLVVRLFLLTDHPRESQALKLIGLGLLVYIASDLTAGYRYLRPGQGSLAEAGWMTVGLVFGIAFKRLSLPLKKEDHKERESRGKRFAPRLEPLIPIALTYAVVGFILLDWWISGEADWIGIIGAASLSLLLVTRQGVIAGQQEMRQFAALVNTTANLAFICQPDGIIRLANPAFREALGIETEEIEDLQLRDFFDTPAGLQSVLSTSVREGWTGEVSIKKEDGTIFPALVSLRPLVDARQAQTLLAGTAHDLTTIRLREIELRKALRDVDEARKELTQLNIELEDKVEDRTRELEATIADLARLNEELKALDELKTEFVALVSHELRGPLTNIRGGIELIIDNYPKLSGDARDSLGLVQDEIQRLSRFVESILDLSTLEAGRFPLEVHPLPIAEVAEMSVSRLLEASGGDRVKIDLASDLPPVMADERVLGSIFYHLIDNALKYAPEGEILVEGSADPPCVYVSVSDSGPGIPLEERERVFEIFHRMDSSDAREIYGHGLGLAMIQRFLEALDGGIRVDEASGGGAKLTFWLPMTTEKIELTGDM